MSLPTRVRRWLGDDPHPASHTEKLLSGLGAFCGILGLLLVSRSVLDMQGAALFVASMGASAVLLYAVPHSPLSQPWPVVGGHLLSALIAIVCVRAVGDSLVVAALAVGLAIAAMYYLRCLHPPGGATALAIVLGGEQVHRLGFMFLLTPVLLNVAVLLGIAVIFNAALPQRRYPLRRLAVEPDEPAPAGEKCLIAHSDLVYALSQIDTFVDVSEEDLLTIYRLATQHADLPGTATPSTDSTRPRA